MRIKTPFDFLFPFSRLAAVLLAAALGGGCATVAPPDFLKETEKSVAEREVVYKKVDGIKLRMFIFEPRDRAPDRLLPAIIFFHGGGWYGGSPETFFPFCRYFASRGLVAMAAEYRIEKKHGTSPLASMEDGNSAIRWVRAHAFELGVDPDRIIAGGGSSGGHLAACAAMSSGFDDPNDDLTVSAVPQALVLFNPALDVNFLEGPVVFQGRAEEASPIYQVRGGLPPTIIFHGTKDHVVPYEEAAHFCNLMKKAGNNCRMVPFPELEHGFYHYGKHENRPFRRSLQETEKFLSDLGFFGRDR